MSAPATAIEPRPRLGTAILSALCVALVVLVTGPLAGRAEAATQAEVDFFNLTNGNRASSGLGALSWDEGAAQIAREWTANMIGRNTLSHNPNLASQVNSRVTTQWTRLGENVGVGGSVSAIQNAFMNSSGHLANILGDYNRIGIGTANSSDGRLWVTVVFIKGPSLGGTTPSTTPPPPPPSGPRIYARNALNSGVADNTFTYGSPGDLVIACDWNGDGIDSPGIFRNGAFYLRNANSAGMADVSFAYGSPGDTPICGDWNGDGIDTVGIFRAGAFYLRNSNSSGVADIRLGYGIPTDMPSVGDWNGDGIDTISIYRNGVFYLRNSNTPGNAEIVVGYGNPSDRPTVGDWNNDGKDTVGIFRGGSLFLRNTNSTGIADYNFLYGVASDRPIIGDWNGDGIDSLAVVR